MKMSDELLKENEELKKKVKDMEKELEKTKVSINPCAEVVFLPNPEPEK